jgi:hypothetical protein
MEVASEDYPFTSWNSYYDAVTRFLQNKWGKYPKYEEYIAANAWEGDEEIMKSLLQEDHDPQIGLDRLFQCFMDGWEYGWEVLADNNFVDTIAIFVNKGAVINIDLLLQPMFEYPHFEKEILSYKVRGFLLRHIETKFIPDLMTILNQRINWDSIIPKSWKDMMTDDGTLNPEFGDFDTARFKALKYEYLHAIEYLDSMDDDE